MAERWERVAEKRAERRDNMEERKGRTAEADHCSKTYGTVASTTTIAIMMWTTIKALAQPTIMMPTIPGT